MSKKKFVGKIVSDKMVNTVVVAIERKVAHPRYGKLLKRTKRLLVDTNNIEVSVGDKVVIEETKPISKSKNFKIIEKVSEILQSSSRLGGTAGLKVVGKEKV